MNTLGIIAIGAVCFAAGAGLIAYIERKLCH